MAEIGWIDFSKKDRNRVNTILDMIKPEGKVDELGIGILRDGLSNRLFPGISTIQTRARYFFIVPYILWDFLKLPYKVRKKKLPTAYLEEREYEVMWDLAEQYHGKEGNGVIGISKRREYREKIARRPSEIYWHGLYKMNCIDSMGLSASTFLNRVNRINVESLEYADSDDGNVGDRGAGFENFFNIRVPYLENWSDDLYLDLKKSEAGFLRDSLTDLDHSILSVLMNNMDACHLFLTAQNFLDFAKQAVLMPLSKQLKNDIILAHDFAILMEGAHIAYNQELQLQFFNHDCFFQDWENWYESVKSSTFNIEGFAYGDLIEYAPTSKYSAKTFVQEWIELIKADHLDIEKKRALIRNQEWSAKGSGKARLIPNRNDDVKEGSRIGLGLLDYRFRNAKFIVQDIINGLENA